MESGDSPFSSPKAGTTLVELMVTIVILSVAGLGLVGSFSFITRATQVHRTVTLATNLNQEQIEVLKNKDYFEVIPTTAPSYNNNFSPPIPYDTAYYPPTTVTVGNSTFQRLTYVERVLASGNNLVFMPYDSLDTGLKRITITSIWRLGNSWYQRSLTNLVASSQYSNAGGASGQVTDANTGLPVAGADVYAQGNTLFHDFTDVNGNYVMAVSPGNYTLAASAPGYFRNSAGPNGISVGNVSTVNIALTPMATGRVSGTAYINNNLLISQVVASTYQVSSSYDVQYVELYNPTTSTIFIGNASSHAVLVNFTSAFGQTCSDLALTYNTMSVPSNGYYLVANAPTFMVNGSWVNADATFTNVNADGSLSSGCMGSGSGSCTGGGAYRMPCAGHTGTIYLTDNSGNTIDAVGWTNGATSPGSCEGTCYPLPSGGLPRGNQLVRMTSTGTATSTWGNAYDTRENNLNFVYNSPISQKPRNSSNSNIPISGTPAYGALITSNDGMSGSTTAWQTSSNGFHYATFTLVGVATGTWMVEISSGGSYLSISSVSVLSLNASTAVPNSVTSPAWPAVGFNNAILSATTNSGIVSGVVTDPNGNPLPNITVRVEPETTGVTNSNGSYNIAATAGTYSVTANPSNTNANYTSQSAPSVVITPGAINNGNNFVLAGAGRVNGYVCNYSVSNPYPGISINALDNTGNYVALAVSASNGKFTINNLSTGTYTFQAVLDEAQTAAVTALGSCSVMAGGISCSVSAGTNVSIGTFTISGAYGTIAGQATVSGSPITTGALVIATTSTISGALPPNLSSATLLGTPYYMASTLSDGTFNLNVRASTASATFNLYGWYTTYSGNTPNISKKNATVVVTGGQTATRNLAW